MPTTKTDGNIKRRTRTIEGWTSQMCQIEREGETLSIQVKTPNGIQHMVIPSICALDLLTVLGEATALVPAGPLVRVDDEVPE